MRLSGVIFLSLTASFLFAGCSHDGGGNSNDDVPAKLNFTPQSGPALSQAEMNDVLDFVKKNDIDTPSTILISQSGTSGSVGSSSSQNLTANYQAAINQIKAKCTIIQPNDVDLTSMNLDIGKNDATTVSKSSISGDLCPISYESKSRTDIRFTTYDKASHSGKYAMSFAMRSSETITDPQVQKAVRLISDSGEGSFSGRGILQGEATSNYVKGELHGNIIRDVSSSLNFIFQMESIINMHGASVDSGEQIIHIKADGYAKPLNISLHTLSMTSSGARWDVFLNGQKLLGDQAVVIFKGLNMARHGGITANDDGTVQTTGGTTGTGF